MIKNNKGITLTELIISIILISVVIIFLFRLLVDVRYNDKNVDFNRNNQQERAIILKKVQTDFLERKLIGLKDTTNQQGHVRLEFKYQDGTVGILEVNTSQEPQYVMYQNNEGTEKWNLEKENKTTSYNVTCVTHNNSLFEDTSGEFFFIRFKIPMVVSTTSSNSIDDLEFFYVGEKKEVNLDHFAGTNKGSLGNYNANTCR